MPSNNILSKKITFLSLPVFLFALAALAQPSTYVEKIATTPDLTQTDERGHFAEGGSNYCAPVAVSNSFVWLSQHGYPKLLPITAAPGTATSLSARQIALVRILSKPEYMDTKGDEGTAVDNVLLGIKKYITEQGYAIKRLEYQGFRFSLPEFDTGLRHPRLTWIKEGITGKSAVWLNIGWYQYNNQSNTYVRVGGHWITMVGYGVDEYGQPANNVLIAHNPSPRAGLNFHNDYLKLEPIDGVLVSRKGLRGFPRPANGFYKIVSGLPPIPECNTGILEGVVVLELY